MKAAVFDRYGPPDVIRIADVEKPVPKDGEVLLKVRAASLNPFDWHLMRGTPYIGRLMMGVRKPKDTRVGRDVAGQVEMVGKNVGQFKPGDEVFGVCLGACAKYACAGEGKLSPKPENVTFEQAAAVPIAAVTALQGVRDMAQVQAGQTLLINGAAGGVGTFAVQIGKWLGAEVTGVCSTRNVELVRSLGADRVLDYTREDFTSGEQRYDVILDNVANHRLSECRRVLKSRGKYVLVGGGGINDQGWIGPALARAMTMPVLSRFIGQEMRFMMANLNQKDLAILGELMQTGKVTPVIDRTYKFTEVAEAVGYLEQGHARGKVVIVLE
jgi:NADPH:quinone reductase-like Zn-dependent oxidoreductase